MKRLSFIVIGSGWRSLFYGRIAAFYPERFHLAAIVCRREEKAEMIRNIYGFPAAASVEEALLTKPDFVVIAVDKLSVFSQAEEWAGRGFPVLLETPAGMTAEELRRLWDMSTKEGARIQVAEQYFCYPSYQASIAVVRRGYVGEPCTVDLSAVHEYHAASLIRQYLDVGFENMKVFGKTYVYPVMETDSRAGTVTDGTVKERSRVKMTFEFESGKTAFYDFDGVQYHSFIRSRHVNVRGVKGELYDWTLRSVDEKFYPVQKQMVVLRTSDDSGIWRITLGDGRNDEEQNNEAQNAEVLYDNPFATGPDSHCLPQDETAIAVLLQGMGRFIEDGTEVYPLAEALQDAYVRILMEEALAQPGHVVESETQLWGGQQSSQAQPGTRAQQLSQAQPETQGSGKRGGKAKS